MSERGRPVRLLLVNPSPVRGGAEESLLEFLTRCDRARIAPLVACLADGPYVDDLEAAGVPVRRIRAGRLRYPWAWSRAVARLTRLARAADVVVSWQVKGHYYGTTAARLARKPVAWWDHGIRPSRGEPRYWIDNRLPSSVSADLVLASSAASAARHHTSRVIYPGIPLDPFRAPDRERARALLGISGDERAVGIVGRLQPWKGQHVFIQAAASVGDPRARFLVVGGTPGGFSADYPGSLTSLVQSLGLVSRVSFLGQRDDVAALLPGFDVLVNASFFEPFGLTTVEAMAAGVPVVATAAGGTVEIVEHERDGLLVPVGDARALAAAIDRLLRDPAFAATIAAEGRARAFERFDIARYVKEIEDVVIELSGRARG